MPVWPTPAGAHGDIHILYALKLKLRLRKNAVSKFSLFRHSHYLAAVAFIADIYL